MDINDIKKLIDDNYDSYPNMAWLDTVVKYFSEYYSLIPLNQGVYKGNTDDEVKSERMIEDLKGTKVNGWEKYSYEKSPYIPTGDKYGIVCGPGANNNGILVLDVDNLKDFEKFSQLHNINMIMPTLTILTRPDKFHLYFKYPNDGKEYKSRTKGKENCGFDVRGVGGYVLGPGSINPISKKPYTILTVLPIAECPEWLKEWSLNRTINNQPLSTTAESPVNVTQPEILPPNTTTDRTQVVLKQDTLDILKTPGTDGYKSEQLVAKAICQMLWQKCDREQIIYEIVSSPLGIVAKEKGLSWLNKEIDECEEFVKEEMEKYESKRKNNKNLDMAVELYNTMLENEYFKYESDKEFYAKLTRDNGSITYMNIDDDRFSGYIINKQSLKTGTAGTTNNLKMALMRLKSYADEHAKPIEKISRFASINDDILIYNTGVTNEFIAITQNGCKYIPQPELVVKEESDIVPVENIDLESNGLTATEKMFDLLDVKDVHDRHYLTILLIGMLFSNVSKPIILFVGKWQSGKTHLAASLKAVWDPAREEEKGGASLPEKQQDLAVLLNSQSVVLIDNFSDLDKKVQNTLCSAFSKGFFVMKKLYSNKQTVKIPLNAPIFMTSTDIPDNLRSDLSSRMNFFYLEQRKSLMSEYKMEQELNKLLPQVRGELLNIASKILLFKKKYKPTGLKRYADLDLIGQAYYEAIQDTNPVESYFALLKDRIRKDSIALMDDDVIINTFIDIIHDNKDCLAFTMNEILLLISARIPKAFTAKKNESSISSYIQSNINLLNSIGIYLFLGGKRNYGKIYIAGVDSRLKELFGDNALDRLDEENDLILKYYDKQKSDETIDSILDTDK